MLKNVSAAVKFALREGPARADRKAALRTGSTIAKRQLERGAPLVAARTFAKAVGYEVRNQLCDANDAFQQALEHPRR
jgi:hypothetical protein